jgi:hypothetical protein
LLRRRIEQLLTALASFVPDASDRAGADLTVLSACLRASRVKNAPENPDAWNRIREIESSYRRIMLNGARSS